MYREGRCGLNQMVSLIMVGSGVKSLKKLNDMTFVWTIILVGFLLGTKVLCRRVKNLNLLYTRDYCIIYYIYIIYIGALAEFYDTFPRWVQVGTVQLR